MQQKLPSGKSGRELASNIQRLHREGNNSWEIGKIALEMAARLDAAEARDHTREVLKERLATQVEEYQAATPCKRQAPPSPNSKFLSVRAAAKSQGIMRASPPSSPLDGYIPFEKEEFEDFE